MMLFALRTNKSHCKRTAHFITSSPLELTTQRSDTIDSLDLTMANNATVLIFVAVLVAAVLIGEGDANGEWTAYS